MILSIRPGYTTTIKADIIYLQGKGEVVCYETVITILSHTIDIVKTPTTTSFIIRVCTAITLIITNPKNKMTTIFITITNRIIIIISNTNIILSATDFFTTTSILFISLTLYKSTTFVSEI